MNRRDLLKCLAGASALPMVATLSVSQLATDDVVVLTCRERLSVDQIDHVKRFVSKVFGGRQVLVLDGGMTLQVYRFGSAGEPR